VVWQYMKGGCFLLKTGKSSKQSHQLSRSSVFSMMIWWTGAILLLAIVCVMANDHVVFTEEPVSITLNSQEMEGFYKPFRKHSHRTNGKLVFCFRYVRILVMSSTFLMR
jgi:hypothetical protein